MSRAFVKEDVDPPERPGRARSISGLPPGSLNYMTSSGQRRLQARMANLRASGDNDSAEIARLKAALESATVVDPPEGPADNVAFGALVTVCSASGERKSIRIVGVDEVDLDEDAVSWISPTGKALLGAAVGDRLSLEGIGGKVLIEKIEYPATRDRIDL